MRIVHIVDTLSTGGTTQLLHSLIGSWPKVTDSHTIIYFSNDVAPLISTLKNVDLIRLAPFIPRYSFDLIPRLISCIKKINPTVIHTILPNACTFGALAGAYTSTPVIWGIHGDFSTAGRFHKIMTWLTASYPAQIIAVSETVKKSFLAQRLRRKKKIPVSVICNGITLPPITTLTHTQSGLNANCFIIGSVGRLVAEKSYDVLLDAFALLLKKSSLPLQLCLVGDGPERAALQKKASDLGTGNMVIFTGHRDDARALYPLFDCFALSSPSEGLSLALLEAMAAGCPVVSTHAYGAHDAITNKSNGLLVPINNPQALATALHKIIIDKKLQSLMSTQNKKLVSQHFNIKTMVQQYYEVFFSLTF